MFAGTGRDGTGREGTFFIPGLHENVSIRDDFTRRTLCKLSIISPRQSGTECLHDKNCPALAGISVCQDGTKNILEKFFPCKRNGANKRYIHA